MRLLGKIDEDLDVINRKYADDNKVTVNNGQLTIQRNGTNVATFTANQSGNSTANIIDTTYTIGADTTNDKVTLTPSTGTVQSITVPFATKSYVGNLTNHAYNTAGNVPYYDRSYIDAICANRSAFFPGNKVLIERSTDGGSTWTTVSTTDFSEAARSNLFAMTRGNSIAIGTGTVTTNCQLRITMQFPGASWYCSLDRVFIFMSTGGHAVSCTIDASTYGAQTTYSNIVADKQVAGWSGPNLISFGSNPSAWGTNSTGHKYNIRLIFKVTSVNSSYPTNFPSISDIRFYGPNYWGTAGTPRYAGHLYTWDYSQNVTFPAKVTASSFSGNLTGNVTGNLTGTASKATGDKNGSDITTTYYKASNPNGYTTNTGTITGVSVNGTSVATSGVANITSVPSEIIDYPTKTYTDIIGSSSANDVANNAFFFGSVRPNSYTEGWSIRYKVHVWVPSNSNYDAVSDVQFYCDQGSINAYAIFNHFYSTSYRPVYYHTVARLKQAGYTAGYGHALAINLADSNNRGDTSLKRSFTVEILEQNNCTVTLLNTPVKWASWTGTGSTNYNDPGNYNFSSNGLTETGDNDNIYQQRFGANRVLGPSTGDSTATKSLYRYMLLIEDKNGQLIPFNFQSNKATTYNKALNTAPFNPFSNIYYYASTTTVAVGSAIAGSSIYNQVTCDVRYSLNIQSDGTSGSTALTAYKPVYIKALYDSATGTATFVQDLTSANYLVRSSIVQDLPTANPNTGLASGKEYIYIQIGAAYSKYQIELLTEHKLVWHWDSSRSTCAIFSGSASSGGTTVVAGTGLSFSGDTLNHSNAVTAATSYVGSATAVPQIKYDAQGHITGTTTATIYPPTTAGTSGQYWKSDGSGQGVWQSLSTSPTSGNTAAITSGGVYTNTALNKTTKPLEVYAQSSAPTPASGKNMLWVDSSAAVDKYIKDGIPIGTISAYGSVTPPDGWLICDGSAVSRTTYSKLFAVIGTYYGAGNGSTTFNLPNLKGSVPVGYDSAQAEFNAIGKSGGEKTHILTTTEMPAHKHSHPYYNYAVAGGGNANGIAYNITNTSKVGDDYAGMANTGGGAAHNNLQPYQVASYIIKASDIVPVDDVASIVNTYSTSTANGYSANYINSQIGTLSNLTTTTQANTVSAINEVNSGLNLLKSYIFVKTNNRTTFNSVAWTARTIGFDYVMASNGNFSLSNNAVVVGEGISAVLVIASLNWGGPAYGEIDLHIQKNGNNFSWSTGTSQGLMNIKGTMIVPVSQGDTITATSSYGDNKQCTVYEDSQLIVIALK